MENQAIEASQQKIFVNMLGGFSISVGDKSIDDNINHSKKMWSLLGYLIVNRNHSISQLELLELLWPEESSEQPASALKVLMHRTRNVLANLEVPFARDLIVQKRGICQWNANYLCVTDFEEFERQCKNGMWTQFDEEKKRFFSEAIDLYKGKFLPELEDTTWAMPLQTYYHSLYLTAVKGELDILVKQYRYGEMILVCQQALRFEQYDEDIYFNMILAFAREGRYAQALEYYDYVSKLFYNQLGTSPPEKLSSLYKEITKNIQNVETDVKVIQSSLKEGSNNPGPFVCNYEVFKNLYQLEARTMLRIYNKKSSFLCLLTVSVPQIKQDIMDQIMSELVYDMNQCLRRGDVLCRYSPSQYLLLLMNLTCQEGTKVMERVIKMYYQQGIHKKAYITYKLSEVGYMTDEFPEGLTAPKYQ